MAIKLKDKETIQVVYKQSEVVLARPVIIVFLALFLPLYFAVAYDKVGEFKLLLFLWIVMVTIFAAFQYSSWNGHTYAVTSQRLICSTREGLFRQTVTETPLDNIMNVKYKTTGLFSTLFEYGDVEIQARGLPKPMVLGRVRGPESVKDYLWKLHEAYTQKAGKML